MASTLGTTTTPPIAPVAPEGTTTRGRRAGPYPYWFYIPAAAIYTVLFLVPTISGWYYSFTRWDLFSSTWIGLKNYQTFFAEQALVIGLRNTLIYATMTSSLKVVIGMLLAVLLTAKIVARGYLRSVIFFPVLVSTIGVGMTFTVLMDPEKGLINKALGVIGITGPDWLVNPKIAIFSIGLVDVWQGVGLATVIFIAGIVSIPSDYYEAAEVDGAGTVKRFTAVTLPGVRPTTTLVVIAATITGANFFTEPYLLTGRGGPAGASVSPVLLMYTQGIEQGHAGYAAAIGVLLAIGVIAVSLVNRYLLERS